MTASSAVRVTVVDRSTPRSPLLRLGVSRALGVALAFCVVLTIVFERVDFDPTIGTRRFHVALETADALVLIFLAAVLIGRFRSDGSLRNLLLATGAVVLAVKNGYFAANAMFVDDPIIGTDPLVWGTAASGVVGAAVFATAGCIRDRRVELSPRSAAFVILSGAIAVLVLDLAASVASGALPEAFPAVPADDEDFTELDELDLLSGHPLKIAVDVLTSAAYAVAAVAFARIADRYRDNFVGWLAVGSIVASCAFIYYAMIPSRFTELLYGGEILWLCAILAFWYGAVSEISNLESALVRSAVRAERKRVARDLHDGVVQELAFIATQKEWLLQRVSGTPYEAPVRRIGDAVDRALDESRGAIAALNRELDEPLAQAIALAAGDVADRFGLTIEPHLAADVTVDPEWRDALIRIAREAVGNAARHGGASRIELRLERDPLVFSVTDDGTGFDMHEPRSAQSFGLQSMRERAEALGGGFSVTSRPGAGTTVTVRVPARQ